MSDMVLANNNFTNNWPVAGCSSCLPGGRTSAEWTRGTYMEGALALYRINPNLNLYDYAVQWGALFKWQLSYGDLSTDPDGQCAGQEYIELYTLDPIPANTNQLTHISTTLTYWVSNNIGLTAWSLCRFHPHVHARLCQAQPRSTPTPSPALKNNATYAPEMYAFFHQIKSVYGRPTAFTTPQTISGGGTQTILSNYTASDGTKQKCYWSRGNGWAFVALGRTMDVLPTNDPHYTEYLQTFHDMAAAIKAVQRADGFWNVNLAYTNDYPGPESSGTACFVYGMAWGINKGYLAPAIICPPSSADGTRWPTAAASHHRHRHGAGFLGYEQGAAAQPSNGQPVTYTSVPNFDDFGLGLFLLAGSEVYSSVPRQASQWPSPVLNGNQLRLNFTVISSLTNATINLLQTSQLGGNWTTNTSATLSTNLAGKSY